MSMGQQEQDVVTKACEREPGEGGGPSIEVLPDVGKTSPSTRCVLRRKRGRGQPSLAEARQWGGQAPQEAHLSGLWCRPTAPSPVCGVAFLAVSALELVWCLFATDSGCLTLDGRGLCQKKKASARESVSESLAVQNGETRAFRRSLCFSLGRYRPL